MNSGFNSEKSLTNQKTNTTGAQTKRVNEEESRESNSIKFNLLISARGREQELLRSDDDDDDVSNFRVAATSANFFDLPFANSRLQKALIRELNRVATSVAIQSTLRTELRPAIVWRLPLCCPESSLIGATPTSLAICPQLSSPSSGN